MAYENLLKSVEESAQERERELRENARNAVEDLKIKAKKQAEAIQQSHLAEAEKSAMVERNKLLYIAKGENKEHLIKIKEHFFSLAFHEAEQRLSQVREDPAYPVIFKKMTMEAIDALAGQPFVLHVDKRDEDLLQKTLTSLNISCGIITDLQCSGGLIASSPDGSVNISNTVESRLERAKARKKLEIYSILFGD